MALTPAFFSLPSIGPQHIPERPEEISDQHFGMGLLDTDLHPPILYRGYKFRPRTQVNVDHSGQSKVTNEVHKFQVMLNVDHFTPEEISVKTVDNCVVVHGKHEEKSDEHGLVAREFTRRYLLPDGTDPKSVVSSLSPIGVLTIDAPKIKIENVSTNDGPVPTALIKKENEPSNEGSVSTALTKEESDAIKTE